MRVRAERDVEAIVEKCLSPVGMSSYADRFPAQLSCGQQQRVALARAIANKPKVLLLDEPLGALDLKLRKQMQIELKALQETARHHLAAARGRNGERRTSGSVRRNRCCPGRNVVFVGNAVRVYGVTASGLGFVSQQTAMADAATFVDGDPATLSWHRDNGQVLTR